MIVLWKQKGYYGAQNMPLANWSNGKILPNDQAKEAHPRDIEALTHMDILDN